MMAGNGAGNSGKLTRMHPARIERRRIAGVDALLLPTPGAGLISFRLAVRRGSTDEKPGEHGLGSFTASMLSRGTERRSSQQIAFELEELGAIGGHGGGTDTCQSSLKSAVEDFPAAAEIFFDCLRNPSFDENELEIQRESLLSYLKRVKDEKFQYTFRHYIRRIFAGHSYGHNLEGEETDVRAVTAQACRGWHQRTYHPDNMLIVAAGDFEPDALAATLEPYFEDWPTSGPTEARYEKEEGEDEPTGMEELTQKLEQGFIVMGYRTPSISHPDYFALRLACAALGEGFTGRLFTHLRDERSLAYAVGSSLASYRLRGHMMLYIGTQPERLDEAYAGLLDEAEAMKREELSEADLNRARNYVAGKYLMGHQSLDSRTAFIARWVDAGLGPEFDAEYLDRLEQVTAKDVLEAARKWWTEPTSVMLRPEGAPVAVDS